MENKDLKSHQKKNDYEMHLIKTLETFVREVRIPKTEFEKYLAAEIYMSGSAVHNMFQNQQVIKTWSSPDEDINRITRIKEGFPRAVDKYIKDNPNSKVDIAYWEKYRELYTRNIGYICALINGYSALEMIEKQYACVKIRMVHELLISSEEFGGDVSNSILLVLNDIELWKRRGYKLQADKKASHTDNIISIVVATILCATALYVLDAMGKMFPNVENFNIFGVGVIQISTFVFILFLMFVLAKSIRNLTENWLNNEALMDADYIISSYDTVMNYDEKKEKKKSILFALPFVIGTAAAFYFEQVWIAVICILLVAFMLMQHRVGYNMAKKDVNRELYIALPQWLMEIALLLQGNNVQVSIAKSRVEAPAVLQKELMLLTERLQKEPDRLSSYTDFCKDFDVPEVQSCMKMLHAISESGTGNAAVQINNLIQRVNEMQDMADNIRNESIAFRMKMLFSYPVLAATVKLLIDLTLGMFYMLQLLGSMGGV